MIKFDEIYLFRIYIPIIYFRCTISVAILAQVIRGFRSRRFNVAIFEFKSTSRTSVAMFIIDALNLVNEITRQFRIPFEESHEAFIDACLRTTVELIIVAPQGSDRFSWWRDVFSADVVARPNIRVQLVQQSKALSI